jgi:hypothetical protein
MSVLFKTDYAADKAANRIDPVWLPDGYQAPSGKITLGLEADGSAYQRHECQPGVNWNNMQRADTMTRRLDPYLREGQEFAVTLVMMLEPGFSAPNPGWSATGLEAHDVRGSIAPGVGTQASMILAADQNGVMLKVFGGVMSTSTGAPANDADKFYSARFPFTIGEYHRLDFYQYGSADRTKGRVRLAIDGAVVIDKVCATIYTGSSSYWKQPYYRDPNQSANKTCAIRCKDLTAYIGAGCWAEALEDGGGTPVPPEPGPDAPVNKGLPVIRGDLVVDEQLTVTPGEWDGSPTAYAYQWQYSRDDGAAWGDVSGATLATFEQSATFVNCHVRCRVTATNPGGATQVFSEKAGPILAVAPEPVPPTDSLPLTVTGGPPTVHLSWTPPAGATGYTYWKNGKLVSSTKDGSVSSVKISVKTGDKVEVRATGPFGSVTV